VYDHEEIKRMRLTSLIAASVGLGNGVFKLMYREEAAGEEHRKVRNHTMFHYYFVSVAMEFRNAYPI
jgi:hypothetical protein